MNQRRLFKREQLFDYLLGAVGLGAAWEGVRILLVVVGLRERHRTLEFDMTVCAALAVVLGLYVMVQTSRRMTGREDDRNRKLAEFHDKAERARAASKQS